MSEEVEAIVVTKSDAVQPGTTVREDFAGTESTALAETSSAAVAAQARANVEARYVMAMKNPRDWDAVRQALLKECKRPRFAELAKYRKPVGGKEITGPSIRFVEVALRCMRNVQPESQVIFDAADRRIVRVSVTELESNITYSSDIVVLKTVERKQLSGQDVLSMRTNSQGQKTYTVRATDDDLLNKQNALVSKALRTNGLRIIPGDLIEEALEVVSATLESEVKSDPDAARKKLIDGFANLGVKVEDLKAYVGSDLDKVTPKELEKLRGVFVALKDGETTWREVLETKEASAPPPENLKERLKSKAKEKEASANGEVSS